MATLTLRQLELFAALPRYQTLRAAAAALHISESALSHAISEIEKVVEEQLCVRRKARGLQLTPAGHIFAARARQLVRGVDDLVDEMASSHGVLSGPVQLGCYVGIASTVLPPILDGFAARHPKVDVDLTIGTDDELLPQLLDGHLDIVITYDMYLPAGVNTRVIYQTDVVVVCAAEHRLAANDAVNLTDLADEPLILLDSAPSAANTHKIFAEHNVRPQIRHVVPSLELVHTLVGRNLGYSLLMSRPNFSGVTSEGTRVVAVPLRPRVDTTAVVAVWPTPLKLSHRVEAMIAEVALELGR